MAEGSEKYVPNDAATFSAGADQAVLGADGMGVPGPANTELTEKEKKQVDLLSAAKENFSKALLKATGESILEESVKSYYQPENDLLTLPDGWHGLDSTQKQAMISQKFADYRVAVYSREESQRRSSDGILPSSISGDISSKLGVGHDLPGLVGSVKSLFDLQIMIDQGITPCNLNVYNSTGLKEGSAEPRVVHAHTADYDSKSFTTLFGVDLTQGEEGERHQNQDGTWLRNQTVYSTSLENTTLVTQLDHQGDTAHETNLVNLHYEYPKEAETESSSGK